MSFFHFEIGSVVDLLSTVDIIKKYVLFNDNYDSDRPVDSKESSAEDLIHKVNVSHQEIVNREEDRKKIILIYSEQKSSILGNGVYKSNYPHFPQDHAFLLKHYISLMKIDGYRDLNGSSGNLLCVSGFTHSSGPFYGKPNLLLSGQDLDRRYSFQYMTPLFQVNKDFLKYT